MGGKDESENGRMETEHTLLGLDSPTHVAAQAMPPTGGTSLASATDANSDSPISHSQSQQPEIDLFISNSQPSPQSAPPPLADRMRPRTIDEVIGQSHILGPNSPLRSSIACNRLPSIVLCGPPGSGKTSIARAISLSMASHYRFVSLSAVTSGVKDLRQIVDEARKHPNKTVLFVDEVHRFSKSQQDSFLPVIEDGTIVFIGATTENPSFHLIAPLLSRSRVFTLNPLGVSHIASLLARAIADPDRGLSSTFGVKVEVGEGAVEFLSSQCDGDARVALNALEMSAIIAKARVPSLNLENLNVNVVSVTVDDAKEAILCKHLVEDEHYNMISALHESMRGSDAIKSTILLAVMLEGGDEPLYIAKSLVRFASEDVGLGDPYALVQAVSCYQACHLLGMPECDVILAQCVTYLALAPKSVAVHRAIEEALDVVRKSIGGNEGVPLHLRNTDNGYGEGYIYTPDNPLESQSFLPPSLEGHKFLHWP